MKLKAALEIIRKEIETIQGATPKFYIAVGFLLGAMEDRKLLENEVERAFEEITVEEK